MKYLELLFAASTVYAQAINDSGSPTAETLATASIDCSSGTPDVNSNVSIKVEECRAQCISNCAKSVYTDDDLENCLSSESLKGCLFDVTSAKPASVEACSTGDKSQTVVLQVSGDDLFGYGQSVTVAAGKMEISEVTAALQLQQTAKAIACSNKKVKIGTSTKPFSADTCEHEGTLTLDQSFTVSGDLMLVPIGDALKGLWGQKNPGVIIVQLAESDCGPLEIVSSKAYIALSYQAGHVDSEVCGAITDCIQCMVANCHWCNWNRTVNTLVPSWLPNWNWVNEVRENAKGKCGLNSAICEIALGDFNVCSSVNHRITVPALVASALLYLVAF